MAPRPVQFIVNPTSSDESQQRLARSHAARSAHARARRLRTIQYQAQRRQEGEDRRHERVSETGLLSFLSAHRRDPFASCAKPLRAIEQRLFDHYVTVIIPHMRCSGLDVHFVERMNQYWVPLAITKTTLLDVMFLGACRQLSDFYHGQPEQQHYTRLAVQYKLQILQGLRQAISVETPQFSDSTIITTIMLAHDEMLVQDTAMLIRHVKGVVEMVRLKGGPQTLGLQGLLERSFFNLTYTLTGEIGVRLDLPWY